jgi:predicted transcriptional regulator
MLNSWGTTKSRPDGLFMVSMDMNYSCTYSGLGYAYYWMTLDAEFERAALPMEVEEMSAEGRNLAKARAAERKIEEAREELEKARADIDNARERWTGPLIVDR